MNREKLKIDFMQEKNYLYKNVCIKNHFSKVKIATLYFRSVNYPEKLFKSILQEITFSTKIKDGKL